MTSRATPGPGPWRGPLWLGNLLVGVLAVLSPFAVFLALRIGVIRSCTGINVLGLPWHPVASTTVMILAMLVAIASLAMIIAGFATRGMRLTAGGAVIFGVVAVVPVLFFLFLSVYGDPGTTCNPI